MFTGEKYRAASPISAYSCSTASARLILKDWDMSKIKKYETGLVQVPFMALLDPDLSLQAKGLFAYICSKPDGWVFCVDRRELNDDYITILDARKELIERGYLL